MKRIICCKKHWKIINKMIKPAKGKPYKEWLGMEGILGNICGIDFDVEIRPYLKKVWIVDLDKFKWRVPEEIELGFPKYKIDKMTGITSF